MDWSQSLLVSTGRMCATYSNLKRLIFNTRAGLGGSITTVSSYIPGDHFEATTPVGLDVSRMLLYKFSHSKV